MLYGHTPTSQMGTPGCGQDMNGQSDRTFKAAAFSLNNFYRFATPSARREIHCQSTASDNKQQEDIPLKVKTEDSLNHHSRDLFSQFKQQSSSPTDKTDRCCMIENTTQFESSQNIVARLLFPSILKKEIEEKISPCQDQQLSSRIPEEDYFSCPRQLNFNKCSSEVFLSSDEHLREEETPFYNCQGERMRYNIKVEEEKAPQYQVRVKEEQLDVSENCASDDDYREIGKSYIGKRCRQVVSMAECKKDILEEPQEQQERLREKKRTLKQKSSSSPSPSKSASQVGSFKAKASELRGVCQAFDEVESDVIVTVESGETFDLHTVQIKKHVPDTKAYRIFSYKNPKSKRFIKVLKCDQVSCDKWFRKWHNFFDHLRIHTNERPYACEYPNCNHRFTQRANLNKHIEVHEGHKRFTCEICFKSFFTNFNLKSHKRTHGIVQGEANNDQFEPEDDEEEIPFANVALAEDACANSSLTSLD